MSDLRTFLPLKAPELHILTVLAGGARHGYGIRQDVFDQTGGQIEIEAGALYRHIRRLEDDGLVIVAAAPKDETDERRIYYRLSTLGNRVLTAEMQRLRELVRLAEAHGILSPVSP